LVVRSLLDILFAQVANQGSRWSIPGRVVNFKWVQWKLKWESQTVALKVLDKLHVSKGPPVIIHFEAPPVEGGDRLWGLNCRESCGYSESGPSHIFINLPKIQREGSQRASLAEVLAHESRHNMNGEFDKNKDAKPQNEGAAYYDSIMTRLQEGLSIDKAWLEAHPTVKPEEPENRSSRDPNHASDWSSIKGFIERARER